MAEIFLSIVIPAFNEARRLPATLRDIREKLKEADFIYEVIVVDDGSVDETRRIATETGRIFSNFKLIANDVNQGKGAAVRRGMLTARGRWRLFMDADNSTAIGHFWEMQPFLESGYDIVFGSREVSGAVLNPPQPLLKVWAGDLGNFLMRLLGLTSFRDTQCGFKCFSDRATGAIFPLAEINGWAFDLEILFLGNKLGFKIKEIPVVWSNNADSRVKMRHYFSTLAEIGKIRRRFWKK